MASSITLKSSSYEGRYMQLVCTQAKDTTNNKSVITWTLSSVGGESNYYSTGPTTVIINGTQVYYKARVNWDEKIFPAKKGSTSGTITIDHGADGSKTISVSMKTVVYQGTGSLATYSTNWTLDQIPRQAFIKSASNFTDLDNPSISFSNPGGVRMDVWLEPNPVSDHLCIRENIPNAGSYTWTLSDAERTALRNKCAGQSSCTIRIGLYSYVDGVQYASYVDKTLTIAQSTATQPSVSVSVSPDNGSAPSTLNGVYVQNKSKINVNISAAGKFGASIASYSASIQGKTYTSKSFTTDVLTASGTLNVTVYAKDSRGFTGSATQQINVIAYSAPWITSFSVERQTDETTVVARLKGGISPISNKNAKSFTVTLNGVTKEISTTSYDVDGAVTFTNVTADTSLTATAQISDSFSSTTKSAVVPTASVTLDFKANGKGIAFGKVAEKDALDSAWDIYMKGNLVTTMANFQSNHGELGYQKLPGGLVIQWGTSVVGTSDTVIEFPTAFSEACLIVVGNAVQYANKPITFWNRSKTSFTMSSGGTRLNVMWIAIGK